MKNVVQQVQHVDALPPLPDSFVKIQQVANNPSSSFKEIANIIQKDPLLTANILKFANSPLYGFKEPINSVQQAISLFGISTIVGFTMNQTISNTLNVNFSPYKIGANTFLEIVTMQNAIAYRWQEGLNRENTDIMLAASFLMEIGSLLIADYITKEDLESPFHEALNSERDLTEIEIELCGRNHLLISADMFEVWGLDPKISKAIRSSATHESLDEVSARLAVISTAINLKEQLSDHSIQAAVELAERFGLDGREFQKIIEQIRE